MQRKDNRGQEMEECIRCGRLLNEDIEYTNIPHTDVYYCDSCLYPDRPERASEKTQGDLGCGAPNSMET